VTDRENRLASSGGKKKAAPNVPLSGVFQLEGKSILSLQSVFTLTPITDINYTRKSGGDECFSSSWSPGFFFIMVRRQRVKTIKPLFKHAHYAPVGGPYKVNCKRGNA